MIVWDKKMVHTQFNWCWYHVPTFAPYKVEGVFSPLILASGTAAQTTKTALVVLQSLTPNAQSVFKILAEYQLANEKEEGQYSTCYVHKFLTFWISYMAVYFLLLGMPINTLYTKCRERFLVSSQVTLNSHLTEFRDHELVKTRRHSDGQDCLYIPLSSEALEKLLPELAWICALVLVFIVYYLGEIIMLVKFQDWCNYHSYVHVMPNLSWNIVTDEYMLFFKRVFTR